jgi:hypothetical protein
MEEYSLAGRINVSATVAGRVKALFELESRGSIEVKHERAYEMFFLNRLKHEYSRDHTGNLPNENLRLVYGA